MNRNHLRIAVIGVPIFILAVGACVQFYFSRHPEEYKRMTNSVAHAINDPAPKPAAVADYNEGYINGVFDGMSLFNNLYISNGYVQLPNFSTKWIPLPEQLKGATNRLSIR